MSTRLTFLPGHGLTAWFKRTLLCPHAVVASLASLLIAAGATTATGHGVVARRMFIEPLSTEDANVKNELGLPRGEFVRLPDGTMRSVAASIEKELYPHRVSVIAEVGRKVRQPAISGWDNLEVGVKWQAWTNGPHEFAVSAAMFGVLPTASPNVADRETAVRPVLAVAKGFGEIGIDWLRPLAVQADVGYERSIHGGNGEAAYDAVLMYSIPYLNHWVRKADASREVEETLRTGLSWASIWGNLFPFVEFNGRRSLGQVQSEKSGRLRPGVCWMGKYLQVSVAADMNPSHAAGGRPHGITVLADWFLDEIFPGLGKTPFGRRAGE